MGEWTDFPLPDGSYSDDTRPWSQQDVVNYLPTFAELPGTRSRLKLEPVPGLKPYAVVGDGPHRGARDVEGRSFVVSGNRLYRVTAAGVVIPIGTIPGTGFVSMTHNQIAGGNELVIGTRDNSYVYNTATDTLTATGVGLSSVDFLGQMILGLSTDRRFWRHSALADATTYSDLDVYSAESAPDRLVGGIASQSEWLAFGERTIETFVNQPSENAAFQRMTGTVVEKGCANGNTIRRLDNSVFWLGDDLIVYRMQGYQPVPISTKAMAAAFRECDPAKAFAFTYEDHGYVIYYLTFQDGQTWGYDVTNQRWHRRESFGLDRWRLNTLFKSNGEWYGGDYSNGNLYKLEWGYMFEGESAVLPRRLRSGVMHSNGNRVFVHGLKLLVDSGLAPSTGVAFPVQPTGPTITGAAPDGAVGVPYAGYTYTLTGTAPLTVTLRPGGELPPPLEVSAAGVINTSAPTELGSKAFTLRVTDANGLWDELTDTIVIRSFIADNNWYAVSGAVSDGKFLKSPDGLDWSADFISAAPGTAESYKVIISEHGRVVFCDSAAGRTTDDQGATFTPHTGIGTELIFRGCFAQGKYFLSAANRNVKSSVDGIAWTVATAGQFGGQVSESLRAIAGNDNLIVAAGYWPRVSSDAGATWTVGSAAVFSSSFYVFDMACSDSLFIAVGQGNKISSSVNGLIWTPLVSPFAGTPDITCVSYSVANGWVIGSGTGQFAHSSDGVNFTLATDSLGVAINGIASDPQGLFVAVGMSGNLKSSTDKDVWTPRANNFGVNAITDIARAALND